MSRSPHLAPLRRAAIAVFLVVATAAVTVGIMLAFFWPDASAAQSPARPDRTGPSSVQVRPDEAGGPVPLEGFLFGPYPTVEACSELAQRLLGHGAGELGAGFGRCFQGADGTWWATSPWEA